MENVQEHMTQGEISEICPGLILVRDFLSEDEERELLQQLDSEGSWDERLSRRVQHYGYEFDYASRKAFSDHPMIPFPSAAQRALDKVASTVTAEAAGLNQLTVNEYLPGQGISAHIDTHSCFGDMMLSISLGAGIVIRFLPASANLKSDRKLFLWLPPRSLLVMAGPSRFAFKHAIPLRKTDSVDGAIVKRERRVSLTFRSIRLPAVCRCEWSDACDSQDLELEPTRIPVRAPLAVTGHGAVSEGDDKSLSEPQH